MGGGGKVEREGDKKWGYTEADAGFLRKAVEDGKAQKLGGHRRDAQKDGRCFDMRENRLRIGLKGLSSVG